MLRRSRCGVADGLALAVGQRKGVGLVRSDGERNRARVLAAAAECFADPDAPDGMADIARRAGVGVGTVYRGFGDRPQLMEAVYCDAVEGLTRAASRLASSGDPWHALETWLRTYSKQYRMKRAMLVELRVVFERRPELLKQSRRQSIEALEAVLVPAQAAGVARADVDAADVLQLVQGIADRPVRSRRNDVLLDVVLRGLKL